MQKFNLILLTLLAMNSICTGQKISIAIAPFQVPKDMQYRYDFNGTGLLENIPTLLEAELFKTDNYIIVERARLNEVIDEQILSNAGLTEKEIEFGKLVGVDYFVMGSISGFSAEVDNVEVNLGSQPYFVNSQKIVISLTVKLIEVRTGKVLSVITEESEVSEKGRPRKNRIDEVKKESIDKAAKEVVRLIANSLKQKTK